MAIVTEITNYANTEIPFLRCDDLIPYLNQYPTNASLTVNGKTVDFIKATQSFDLNKIGVGNLSDYYMSEESGVWKSQFAIKSKNDVPFKYITFSTQRSTSGWVYLDISITKEPQGSLVGGNGGTYWTLANTSMGSSKRQRVAIVEVGEYIGILTCYDDRNGYYQDTVFGFYNYISKSAIDDFLGAIDGRTYDTEFGGVSDADGYDPNFDNSSDIIPVPNMPSVGVSNVGFVNVYKTTQGALQNLGSDLFPDFVPPPTPEPTEDLATTIAMGFTNVVENLSNLLSSYINSNLINYIIDCHCLPVSPTVGESEPIKIGFKQFPQSAMRVKSDYVDFNCGTLNLKEYYGNFIDYVGTRASLYLPFIGFVPIKNEYFQDGELTVKYRFNIIDGSFMAYVLATSSKSNLKDTVIGTYSGNACVHIPITGVNYSNMVSGLVNGATAIASASKGVGGVAINTALSTLSMKPEMQSNNSYNATSSFLGIRYPYLLIEREVSNFSELYPNECGVPLNATKTINELTGYIEMDENIHIELNCMDEERQMILELLTGGIII